MSTPVPTNLLDFDVDALSVYFKGIGEPGFRAQQIIKWVHQLGVTDFAAMTNLSKVLRERLHNDPQSLSLRQ